MRHEFLRLAVELDGVLVTALDEVGGTEVVDGLGVVGTDEQGFLIVLAGFIESKEVMVGDAELVESDGGDGRLAVGVDGSEILLAGHHDVAAFFGGKRGAGRDRGGLRESVGVEDAGRERNERGDGQEEGGEKAVEFHGGTLLHRR